MSKEKTICNNCFIDKSFYLCSICLHIACGGCGANIFICDRCNNRVCKECFIGLEGICKKCFKD